MNLKPITFLGCFGSYNGRYRGVTGVGRDSLATNGLFTLRNRLILMNLSRGIKTPTPLYWSKNISTDLRDSRGWSIWFEKNGIPKKKTENHIPVYCNKTCIIYASFITI